MEGERKWNWKWLWLLIPLALIGLAFWATYQLGNRNAASVAIRPTPTTQAAPTSAPANTPVPTKQPAALLAQNNGCPTTEWAKNETGIDVQRVATEPCAWVWRGGQLTPAKCVEDMICTFDTQVKGVEVFVGDGETRQIYAGTFRWTAGYPAGDAVYVPCQLLSKEQVFGRQEVPSFEVYAGNFDCPQKTTMVIEGTGSVSSTNEAKSAPGCPLFAGYELRPLEDGGCKLDELGFQAEAAIPQEWWTHRHIVSSDLSENQ